MKVETLRAIVRPSAQLMIMIMIGPVTIMIGMFEAFIPGAGVRFANGCLAYIGELPESFWLFAGAAVLGHEASRSWERAKEANAIAAFSASNETKSEERRDE